MTDAGPVAAGWVRAGWCPSRSTRPSWRAGVPARHRYGRHHRVGGADGGRDGVRADLAGAFYALYWV